MKRILPLRFPNHRPSRSMRTLACATSLLLLHLTCALSASPLLNAQLLSMPQTDVDMTAEGNLDFIVPSGDSSGTLVRKASSQVALSALGIHGDDSTGYYNPGYQLTWSDGDTISSSGGLYYSRVLRADAAGDQYFSFTAPATTATRTVRIYLNEKQSNVQAQVTASLADGSASPVTVNGTMTGVVEINYRAASETDLHVTFENQTDDGLIRLFGITLGGAAGGSTIGQDIGITIPANAFDAESDPGDSFRVRNTGSHLSSLVDGTWIRFDAFDFGTAGATSFTATATTNNAGGDIELRLGSPTGTLIGTLSIPSNGSWNDWTDYTTSSIIGEYNDDLYMVFTGDSGPNGDQTLFNFREFRFD